MRDVLVYFRPGFLERPIIAGARMPTDAGIVEADRLRRAAAATGSRKLHDAIVAYRLRGGAIEPRGGTSRTT